MGQCRYSSTTPLDGGERTVSRPGRFTFVEKATSIESMGAGWDPRRSGRCDGQKSLLSLTVIEPRFLGRLAHSLVAIPTELSRYHLCISILCNFFQVIESCDWIERHTEVSDEEEQRSLPLMQYSRHQRNNSRYFKIQEPFAVKR
jgi:hypothetical protein